MKLSPFRGELFSGPWRNQNYGLSGGALALNTFGEA